MNRRYRAVTLMLMLAAPLPWASSAARAATTAGAGPVLPFIDDDYGKALALAKQKKVPIFVEAWAPW